MDNPTAYISLDKLKLYFQLLRWKNVDTNYSGLEAYISPEDENLYTLLPKQEIDKAVTSNYINKTVNLISELENQPINEVISIICDLDSDHHLFKLQTTKNNISLNLLEGVIKSTKQTLFKNAYHQHKAWYDTQNSKKRRITEAPSTVAKGLINSLNFPHTKEGSFCISINVPLKYESYPIFDEDKIIPETIERKVNIVTARGLKIFAESAKKKSANYAVDRLADKKVINSFKQFTDLIDDIEKWSFQYSLNLSPIFKGENYNAYNKLNIDLNRTTFTYIQKAIDQVGEEEEPKPISFFGFPVNMKSDRKSLLDESGEGTRRVTVRGESQETGTRSLTFDLDIDYYKKALKAHENALSIIIDCTVQKEKNTYDVIDVKSLRIIDELPKS